METGCFVLVVGPSGAGKDSLINEARSRLAEDARFYFPTRVITRPCDPDSEVHDSVEVEEFRRMEADSKFCLSWEAHGLHYGIPVSAEEAAERGRTVVVNVSRSVIDAAESRFPQTEVIHVTASPQILQGRLRQRDRGSDGNIEKRLDRSVAVSGRNVTEIRNEGTLEESLCSFLETLEGSNRD